MLWIPMNDTRERSAANTVMLVSNLGVLACWCSASAVPNLVVFPMESGNDILDRLRLVIRLASKTGYFAEIEKVATLL
jgi:hypothetical protein